MHWTPSHRCIAFVLCITFDLCAVKIVWMFRLLSPPTRVSTEGAIDYGQGMKRWLWGFLCAIRCWYRRSGAVGDCIQRWWIAVDEDSFSGWDLCSSVEVSAQLLRCFHMNFKCKENVHIHTIPHAFLRWLNSARGTLSNISKWYEWLLSARVKHVWKCLWLYHTCQNLLNMYIVILLCSSCHHHHDQQFGRMNRAGNVESTFFSNFKQQRQISSFIIPSCMTRKKSRRRPYMLCILFLGAPPRTTRRTL